ncbi:hypothetical protein [Pseudoxanthomonas kaohsiungensis]|uniref:Secreted protein n=1 Tax=Pseudoxanthomonas kaohsiungensis TaxID=283923 RepID=A0ABW3LTT3_9GAMM|nr:hypothetical protein [Pseudoxanthomonas kaohsiungensis]KAF1700708.1 hypothetical protein CSC66_15260 [Pseudoxanthomonas kaohsiungensis]
MRACKAFLALAGLALTIGAVHASSQQATLRISMTIVDRCDVRNGGASPSVDCSIGVPWTVAPAAAAAASLVADGSASRHFPVPASGPADGARVTTIVF